MAQTLGLFAELLAVPWQTRLLPLALSPREKQVLKLKALHDWLKSIVAKRPLLLVVEDLQWIDPTSRQLLDRLLDWAPRGLRADHWHAANLGRTQRRRPASVRRQLERADAGMGLRADRAQQQDSRQLIDEVATQGRLPPNAVREISERVREILCSSRS